MQWEELSEGLSGNNPRTFIEGLRESGRLEKVLSEIEALFDVPQTQEHHPEICSGEHTLMVLSRAAELSGDVAVRYAALVHDVGKALTPRDQWPRHIGHEKAGVPVIEEMNDRLGVPENVATLAIHVGRDHLNAHKALDLKAGRVVRLFEDIEAFDKPEILPQFLLAVQADSQGRLTFEDRPYPQAGFLQTAFDAACVVRLGTGKEYKDPASVLQQDRARAVQQVKSKGNWQPSHMA